MAILNTEVREAITRCVRRRLPVDDAALYLFGSFARGDADLASDIDLAFTVTSGRFADVAAAILDDLERDVPTVRSFDLVDLATAPKDLKEKIVREGVRWI